MVKCRNALKCKWKMPGRKSQLAFTKIRRNIYSHSKKKLVDYKSGVQAHMSSWRGLVFTSSYAQWHRIELVTWCDLRKGWL